MTDKPIAAKIILSLLNSKAARDFIGLGGTLYQQNLIYHEPRELRRSKNILELSVIFRDYASFKYWTRNTAIKEFWLAKFDQLLTEQPKLVREKDVIIEVDNIKNCNCKKSDFYILQGRSLQFVDELTCSNCLGQVSYARVPLDIELEDWQRKYQRVYLNWLESSLFEKQAYRELTNYKNGKLNLAGEKIRQQLTSYFKIPVYINHFVYEPNNDAGCPVCGQKGSASGMKQLRQICKECDTIFDQKNA